MKNTSKTLVDFFAPRLDEIFADNNPSKPLIYDALHKSINEHTDEVRTFEENEDEKRICEHYVNCGCTKDAGACPYIECDNILCI